MVKVLRAAVVVNSYLCRDDNCEKEIHYSTVVSLKRRVVVLCGIVI